MSVANLVSLSNDSTTLMLENRQLNDHNLALANALRETRDRSEQSEKAIQVLSQDIKDLEDERQELEEALNKRSTRMHELENELSELRRKTAPPPEPPPPPPLTNVDKLIVKALKLIVLNRAEESLEIFARLGGLSPGLANFYQKLFHNWVVLGNGMEGNLFARRIVFGLRGKLHERFLRAYCVALEQLSRRPAAPPRRRRQWLLELAELHLEHPRQAMRYLLQARKAS